MLYLFKGIVRNEGLANIERVSVCLLGMQLCHGKSVIFRTQGSLMLTATLCKEFLRKLQSAITEGNARLSSILDSDWSIQTFIVNSR